MPDCGSLLDLPQQPSIHICLVTWIRIAFSTNFLFIFASLPYVHKYFSELKAKITENAYANSTIRDFSSFLVSSIFEMKAKTLLDT